jgi:DNA-directed RNA polymerase specialized sigma24 family protein
VSTNALPAEPEWLVKSRKVAYCARRRLTGADLSPQDMEDLIQAATLAYWKHHREGRPVPFCFVCAHQAAEKYFYRQVRGRNPRSPLSLDASFDDGGDLPHEWLTPSTPTDDGTLRLDWLSDEVLEGVLFEARQASGFSKRDLTRTWNTLQTDKRVIRLAANGHTNASIAELMGTTEGTIRNHRQRIRRLLKSLLPLDALVEYDRSGGNQQRAREIQLTYPDQQKPVPVQ